MFQRIIHQDLRPILQKYPKNFRNYLDDTWQNPEGRARHQRITHELFDLIEKRKVPIRTRKRVGGGEI